MNDIIRSLIGREPRYQITNTEDLDINVEKSTDDGVELVRADLVDISHNGAKLRIDRPLAVRDTLAIELDSDALKRRIEVAGEVCWMTPANGGKYLLGCSFSPPIPPDTLTELAEGGVLERRQHDRERIEVRANCRWELSNEDLPVWVLNFSEGGVCMLSQDRGKPGERVIIAFENDDKVNDVLEVRAKGHWQIKTDEGYVIGCELLDAEGYKLLKSLQNEDEDDDQQSTSLWKRLVGKK